MPGIRTEQIAFVPAHQKPRKPGKCRHPGKDGAHIQKRIARHIFHACQNRARNIGKQGEKDECALPHNRRLAAEEIPQQETVCRFDVAAVQTDGSISKQYAQRDKSAHRLEKPAQKHGNTGTCPQNGRFVNIQPDTETRLNKHRPPEHRQGKQPIWGIQVADKGFFKQELVFGQGFNVLRHNSNPYRAVADSRRVLETLFAHPVRCGRKT